MFAHLIEYYYGKKDYQQAYGLLKRMKSKGIVFNPYLDQEIVDMIYSKMGEKVDNEDIDDD